MGRLGPYELDTVVCGDCLDVMAKLPEGCVDLVVTDPPYNVGVEYGNYFDNNERYSDWCLDWFAELKRVCSGPIAITVGQCNLSEWARIAPPTWWLAWWKPAAMGRCIVGFNNWEPIALYGKPPRAMCDVIRAVIKPDKTLEGHPCPKPLEWATRQIELLSNWGDKVVVFDLFLGSGTTAVGAKQLGRHYFGCDVNSDYVEIARERLKAVQLRAL